MSDLATPILLVLGLFFLERATVLLATRSPSGCAWIRKHPLFHPNTICLIRIPMGLGSILLWQIAGPTPALAWFAFWMITDLTDGTVARACDLVTETGKWLDPLSDKCMVLPPLLFLALAVDIAAPPPLGIIIAFILVEAGGQASRLFVERTSANLYGKAKTGLTTILLGAVALHQIAAIPGLTEATVAAMAAICLVLGLLSAAAKILPRRAYALLLGTTAAVCAAYAVAVLLRAAPLQALLWLAFPAVLKLLDEDFSLAEGPDWLPGAFLSRAERRGWRRLPRTLRVLIILLLLLAGCFIATQAAPGV